MRRQLAGLFLLGAGAAFAFPNPDGPCSITTAAALPQAVRGQAITYNIATSGCGTLRRAAVVTGTLPNGLTVTTSGTTVTIAGTPDIAGTYAFAVRAFDAANRIPSKSFVIRVNTPVQIDTPALATGQASASYSDIIRARGGVAPYTFSVVEGTLPTGISLAPSTGVLSGTMPAAGSRFRIRVSDSSTPPNVAERPFTILPGGQITTLAAPPVGSVGTPYSFDIDGSLGSNGFAAVLGALPTGLTIDSNGLIGGTPTTAGEYHFTVRETVGTASIWRSYRILVNNAATITGTPRDAEQTFAYDHVFTAAGGVAPYTFSVTAGALPTGITLDAGTGTLLGQLAAGATGTSFTITATDASGRASAQAFSIASVLPLTTPTPPPSFSLTLPPVRVYNLGSASPYSLTQGGPNQQYEQIGGTGRNGIYLNSITGAVEYYFSTSGNFQPVMMGSDSLGGAVILPLVNYPIVDSIRLSPNTELPNGRISVPYSATVPVENGDFTPLTFSLDGALPGGLTLNTTTGAITGTPAVGQAGDFSFTVTVTDSGGQSASRNYIIGIGGALHITNTSVPGATAGASYSVQFTQSGGTGVSWSWAAIFGSTPPGLTLNSGTGLLSGTPTTPGEYLVQIRVDQPGAVPIFNTKQFRIVVANTLTMTISPVSPLEATEGVSTYATTSISGGEYPYKLSVSSGTLPEGLYLNQYVEGPGISGVAELAGSATINLTVTDAGGRTATIPYTINVRKDVVITSLKLAPATRSVAYNQTLTATGGRAPYTWTVSFGALPTGLTLSTAGVISGTPTEVGVFTPEILVVDADGRGQSFGYEASAPAGPTPVKNAIRAAKAQEVAQRAATILYDMPVTEPLVITNAVPLPNGAVLTPYNVQVTTTGGNGTNTYNVSAGDLPPLLALSPSSGQIGTLPLTSGLFGFTLRAEDSEGRTATLAQQIAIGGGLAISPATIPTGTINTPYSVQFTGVGAAGTVTWSITGALPAGITLGTATGLLAGTPTATGSFPITIGAIDQGGFSTSANYTLQILNTLTISPPTVPAGTVGTAYSQALTVAGAAGAVTWTISAGALPPGLALGASTGIISGTPTTAGPYNFTVLATDAQTQTGTRAYSMTVLGVLTIAPPTVPGGTVGAAYSQALTVTGATGTVTWSISAGALPPGVTLGASTGILSGTPTTAGPYSFTVQATDSATQTGTRAYSMTVLGVLTISPPTVPSGTVGTAYTQALTATGAAGAVTWSISAGALPPGVTLGTSTGILSGTPTTAGPYNFTVLATDAQTQTGARAYTLTVLGVLTITPNTLPNGVIGTPYSQALTVSANAVGAVTWSVSSGALAPGLTLGATGIISGTPNAPSASSFVIQATDSQGQIGQQSYTIQTNASIFITPTTLPAATAGVQFSQALAATGTTGTLTWSLINNTSLPAGLTLSPTTGLISGAPSVTPGLYPFQVQVMDAQEQTGQQSYSLQVLSAIAVDPPTLPVATLATVYTQVLTLTAGATATGWSVSAGALPGGLTLGGSNGTISGTPTASGDFTFTVAATTATNPAPVTRSYTMSVLDPLLITTGTLPDAFTQEPYTTTLLTNSTAPSGITWTLIGGSLPAGLTLAPTGVISGTPTTASTNSFTVQATSTRGQIATHLLTILVRPPLAILTSTLAGAVKTSPYAAVLVATGGQTPYVWSLTGALPAGLVLTPDTGVISGTTNAAEGPYTLIVTVRDAGNRLAMRTLVLTVGAAPTPSLTIAPATIPPGRVGQAYSASFSATGGTPGYSFSLAQGALPPGLTFNGSTVAGTPTTEGTFRFTINVTDTADRVTGNLYTLIVESAPVPLAVTPETVTATVVLGQPSSLQFGATGGKAPYSFSITGNTPPGMSSNVAGLLSGTPSQGGTFSFTVEVTDSLQTKSSRTYSVSVTGELTITTRPPVPDAIIGNAFALNFEAAGGRAPYTWSVSGNTPPGLAFNNGGFSGTPTTPGSFTFTVEVRDSQRLSASSTFTIVVFERVEITNSPSDTPAAPGQPFSFTFATRGGKPPLTFAITGGALPDGLSMNAAGTITGTPTTTGLFNFTVQVTDGLGIISTRQATIRIAPALTVTTTALPAGRVETDYTASVAASGGLAPLGNWSVSAGALPAGLTLAPDGTISGKPTAVGTSTFTVRVTDSIGTASTRELTITVSLPPVPPISLIGLPQTLPPGTQTNITIQLAQAFPIPVTGTLTLIFEPNAVNNADDPSVQFSSGGRTVTFTIPAGQTSGTFPVVPLRLLSGTVAGTIRIRTTTSPESETPVPEATVPIARSVPVITAGTAQLGSGTFTLQIDGFSNTREISAASVRLTPVAGAPLETTDISIPVAGPFTTYYQSSAAAPFGGQFRLVVPFNVTGSLNDIESATVTVTNAVGASQPFVVRLR